MPFSFLQLIPELRNMIYEYALVRGEVYPYEYLQKLKMNLPIAFAGQVGCRFIDMASQADFYLHLDRYDLATKALHFTMSGRKNPPTVALLGTCKQIRQEARNILYSQNTFVFKHHDTAYTFWYRVPVDVLDKIFYVHATMEFAPEQYSPLPPRKFRLVIETLRSLDLPIEYDTARWIESEVPKHSRLGRPRPFHVNHPTTMLGCHQILLKTLRSFHNLRRLTLTFMFSRPDWSIGLGQWYQFFIITMRHLNSGGLYHTDDRISDSDREYDDPYGFINTTGADIVVVGLHNHCPLGHFVPYVPVVPAAVLGNRNLHPLAAREVFMKKYFQRRQVLEQGACGSREGYVKSDL